MADFNDYMELISSQPENERYYECLIISHSEMTAPRYLVIDSQPLAALGFDFTPANVAPVTPINGTDLDQDASFTIGDPFNELDEQMELIAMDTEENVVCRYLLFLSDDLDDPVEDISFNVDSVPQKKGYFTIKASVKDLSAQTTGETFNLTDFPMLRAI